jgi:hypothetical protein
VKLVVIIDGHVTDSEQHLRGNARVITRSHRQTSDGAVAYIDFRIRWNVGTNRLRWSAIFDFHRYVARHLVAERVFGRKSDSVQANFVLRRLEVVRSEADGPGGGRDPRRRG